MHWCFTAREVWQRWYPSGITPVPRAACSLVQTRDRVLILGGYNSNWVTPPSTTHVFSAKQVCKQARDCAAEDVAPVYFMLESIEQETRIQLSHSREHSLGQSKSPFSSPRTDSQSMNSSLVSVDDSNISGLVPRPNTPRSGGTSPRVVFLHSSGAVLPQNGLGPLHSIPPPLGLNVSNQSDFNIPEITTVHTVHELGSGSPLVTWRELYEQERDDRMKFQTKLALVENKVESLQSGTHYFNPLRLCRLITFLKVLIKAPRHLWNNCKNEKWKWSFWGKKLRSCEAMSKWFEHCLVMTHDPIF